VYFQAIDRDRIFASKFLLTRSSIETDIWKHKKVWSAVQHY